MIKGPWLNSTAIPNASILKYLFQILESQQIPIKPESKMGIYTLKKLREILLIQLIVVLISICLPAQSNITDSLLHQTYQRKYMVHLPPNFGAGKQRPLVINLHGGSGNMVNAQGFSMFNPVADQNDFIIAWPQGYGIAPPGFSWADGRNTSADQAGIDDVGFIDKLIDTLISRYHIDTQRIYLCGFSNGGFMVQRIACQLPGRFAAMASLGSSMDTVLFKNCRPSKYIPFAFFNGTADPAMPYGGGSLQNPLVIPVVPVDSTVQFWVRHNRCQTVAPVYQFPDTFPGDQSTAELYTFSDCACDADVAFYKLINGGHTWPGVYIASQASVLGNTNRDIHASFELWKFFSAHTRCSTTVGTDEHSIRPRLTLFPNPARSELNISMPDTEGIPLTIHNALGQILLQTQNKTRIDISDLSAGIYFLTIRQGLRTEIQKFVKE